MEHRRLGWAPAAIGFVLAWGGNPNTQLLPDGGGPPPQAVAVTIQPSAVTLQPLGSQRFTADVANAVDRSVDWSISEGAAGGSVDASGLYSAPAANGTFHLVATSRADPKASATAVVTVIALPPGISISIAPAKVTLTPGSTQRFNAVVSGSADTAITWSVGEGSAGGAIDGSGLYTAPDQTGTYHVTATSHADASRTATAEVTVTSTPLPVSITVAPAEVHLSFQAQARFVAVVTNAADTSVTWSVTEGPAGGIIDAAGSYTAPGTAGTYHVVAAANQDPTKTASAQVVVSAPPPDVRIAIFPDHAETAAGGSLSFTATVTGTTDQGVIWSVAESAGGTVDASGSYRAPSNAGLYHVVAAAHADPSRSATAEVTVVAPPPPPVSSGVSIIPQSTMLMAGHSQQFRVGPAAPGAVDVSVVEGPAGGTLDASLLYTAPSSPGTYHVVATARDGSSVTATVIVREAGAAIVPSSVSVAPGGVVQFTTSRPADELVLWVENAADGASIGDFGFYQAPSTPGTYQVIAMSSDYLHLGTATVTVRNDPVYVSLNMVHLTQAHPGDGAAMRATVHGTSDQRVTWSIAEGSAGGSIDADGNYVSPRDHTGTFHIVATSVAAPSASATAVYETCTGVGTCGFQVKDGGGPVMPSSRTYAIFWGDPAAFPSDLQSTMEDLLGGLDGSGYLAIADQYMRGSRTTTRFAGSLHDSSTPGSSYAVDAEICRILDANGVEPRADAIYFLFTSTPRIGGNNFCAWHSNSTCHGVPIQMGYMPNPDGTGCVTPDDLGCGQTPLTRAWASFTAHEFMETITDPGPWRLGWTALRIGEIADPCTGTRACVPVGGKTIEMQAEFSNS